MRIKPAYWIAPLIIAAFVLSMLGCSDADFLKLQDQAREASAKVEEYKPKAESALAYLESVDADEIRARVKQIPFLDAEARAKVQTEATRYAQALQDVDAYTKARQSLNAAEAGLMAFSDRSHTEPHEAIGATLTAVAPFSGQFAPILVGIAGIVTGVGGYLSKRKTQRAASRVVRSIETIKNSGATKTVDFEANADKLKALMGDEGRDFVKAALK